MLDTITRIDFANGFVVLTDNRTHVASAWTVNKGKTVVEKTGKTILANGKTYADVVSLFQDRAFNGDEPVRCAAGCVWKGKIYPMPSQATIERMLRQSVYDGVVTGINGERVEPDSHLSWLRILRLI